MSFLHKLHSQIDKHRQSHQSIADTPQPTGNPTLDHLNLTFTHFYSPNNGQFQAPVKSDGTLGASDNFGYLVWSVAIAVHALADAVLINGDKPDKLRVALQALQKHWSPTHHAFCAWHFYPGNEDIYYDDNAHVVQALVSASQALHDSSILAQAKDILTRFIIPAWGNAGRRGVPWHLQKNETRHACSAGPAGVAALRICALGGKHNDSLALFGESCIRWTWDTLRDEADGLISDNIRYRTDGSVEHLEGKKWTYNTGFIIHGLVLLFERTGNNLFLSQATRLASAALNKNNVLYDPTVPNAADRMYSDGSFFLHHLVDGFLALSRHAMQPDLKTEVLHIANWGNEFMYDRGDGLYFKGSRPWTISEELTRRFEQRFGVQRPFEGDGGERDEGGRLCKCLIGNAGWARCCMMAQVMS